MKTTMNISLDKELKVAFTEYAKGIGTNPTNLINMLMKNTINTKGFSIWHNPLLDIEIERYSKKELNELMSSKSIIKNTAKLRELLSKNNQWM